MAIIKMRTLFVGAPSSQNIVMLTRMGRKGWGSYSADNLSEAINVIQSGSFDVVLAQQSLPDGSAYDLSTPVMARRGSLFVEIELFTESMWIPVIEKGENVFGNRAIRTDQIETELEEVLLAAAAEAAGDLHWKSMRVAPRRPMPLGYEPMRISLGPVSGADTSEPAPHRTKISSIAQLQLRCASFGLLRAGKLRQDGTVSTKSKKMGNTGARSTASDMTGRNSTQRRGIEAKVGRGLG